MSVFFVTYGDARFRKTKKKILKEARSLNIFDKIYSFSEKDLPIYIKSSPLFAFDRGGGYWLWKSYIVHHMLSKVMKNDDILVYVDSGCRLSRSDQWNYYLDLMIEFNGIFFRYDKDKDYNFSKYGFPESVKIGVWTKQIVLDKFYPFSDNGSLFEQEKIMAGAFFLKKNNKLTLPKEWYATMLFYPELVVDDLFIEKKEHSYEEYKYHRHDQSILSLFVYLLKEDNKLLILKEQSENIKEGAILADRRRDISFRASLSNISILRYLYRLVKRIS